jgi:hypothetical protein
MDEIVEKIPFRARTVGEIAARRSYYPFIMVIGIIAGIVLDTFVLRWSVPDWLSLVLWHLPAAIWIWALASLVSAWRDPSARGLRLEASVLLVIGFYVCETIIFLTDFWFPIFAGRGDQP